MMLSMITPVFREDRLNELMAKRDLSLGQVAYLADVSQPMIFYLSHNRRPNVSAVIVAKVAKALGCSVEYLLGMVDEPSPKALDIDDLVMELADIANRLTGRRQRDLLMQARAYLEAMQTPTPPDRLIDEVLDMIAEAGGHADREQLLSLLIADLDGDLPALEDDEEPT